MSYSLLIYLVYFITGAISCLEVPSQYPSVNAAFQKASGLSGDQCINIAGGTYSEQAALVWKGGVLTITGAGAGSTVIVAGQAAAPAGKSLSDSATLRLVNQGGGIRLQGVEVQNTYGKKGVQSQAVALNTQGDHIAVYNSKFTGFQDTAYLQPGKQYFENCHFVGAVDFVCGGASAWFEGGTLEAIAQGALSANRKSTQYGGGPFVFNSVNIQGSAPAGSVLLGRAWGNEAVTQFQGCTMSNIISSKRWDYTSLTPGAKATFTEIGDKGPGGIKDTGSGAYSKSQLWGGDVFA